MLEILYFTQDRPIYPTYHIRNLTYINEILFKN